MTIVEKIKALLAKAASTDSEAEATLFLAKAHELMEKHQLGSSDLETEDPVDRTKGGATANGGASPDWDFQLLFPVAKFFGCEAIQVWRQNKVDGSYARAGQCQMDIMGRESARVTTIEMHKYLVQTVKRLARENATLDKPDTLARRIGRALSSRIYSMVPATPAPSTPAGQNALITLDATAQLVEKLYPKAKGLVGRTLTNNKARDLASGIGLNLQTGSSSAMRLK